MNGPKDDTKTQPSRFDRWLFAVAGLVYLAGWGVVIRETGPLVLGGALILHGILISGLLVRKHG